MAQKFAQTFRTPVVELMQPMPSMNVLPLVRWDSGTRLSSLLRALAVGISLDCLADQVNVILRGKVEQVDVGRLVVISSKRCVLEASVQDTGSEMFAEVCHRHVREERVE